jgi:hypothetical protein
MYNRELLGKGLRIKGDSVEGIKLTPQDGEKLRKSVENLGGRYKQQRVCRYCGEAVIFKPDNKDRIIPHDIDGTPHWKTCPYESLTQKRASFGILKKAAVYFCLKMPDLDLEQELGLSEKEGKVMHAILEKVLRELASAPKSEEPEKVGEDELPFKPEPTDPVGDPDEDIAPDEELIESTSPNDLAKN